MPLPTYPDGLPYIPNEGTYLEPVRPIIEKTEFDFGNTRQRAKRGIPVKARPYEFWLKQKQKKIFEDFVFEDLTQGTSRFRMKAMNKEGFWEMHEVMIQEGIVNYKPYGWRDGQRNWVVTFTLIIFGEIFRDED